LVVLVVLASSVSAQDGTIIWISDGSDGINPGTKNDQGFVDLLTGFGYTVVRKDASDGGQSSFQGPLDNYKKAVLNAADLVIVSRNAESGLYNHPNDWNSVTSPVMLMTPYLARAHRWRWFGTTDWDLLAGTPTLEATLVDPVFDAVPLNQYGRVDVLTSDIAHVDVSSAGNGTMVAQSADNQHVWIARWPAGTEFYSGAGQWAGGERLYFSAGGHHWDPWMVGSFNLNTSGQRMLLNAVEGFAGSQPWLAEANQRIEQHRKGDLTVRVVDPEGQAVQEASVQVNMKRHAFGFGTAVDANWINGSDATADIYREKLLENFNRVVFGNDLKWPAWIGLWGPALNWPNTERALDWLDAHNITARGHHLSWATWSGSDAWGESNDEATLPTRLFDHIADKATTVGNRVTDWDVINHPVGWKNDTYENRFGISFYKQIIDHARSVAPSGMPLWINEDHITNGAWSDDYERIIQYLIDNGSPPDGIGIQGHMSEDANHVRTPEEIYAQLERMASLVPRLKITEFDVNVGDNEQLQAQLLHDYMVLFFSHPAMEEVLMWGFWADAHWLGEDGALYRSDWSEKPALAAYQDLVFDQWWTEEDGATDLSGEFDTRGFLGDYEVIIDHQSGQKVVPLTLEPGSNTLTVVVPEPSAWVLLVVSVLSVGAFRRLRRRAKVALSN